MCAVKVGISPVWKGARSQFEGWEGEGDGV